MKPLTALIKRIDDIEIYFEIYAGGALAQNFDKVFSNGRFVEKTDNVLVMLHGNGEDRSVFYTNVDALCNNDYCILVDSRGHGKTTLGNFELTIDLMSEDISKLCDELNIGNFKLLGFSDGGNVALTYAIRHPERLSHLIVAGANLNPSGLKLATKLSIMFRYLCAKPGRNKSLASKMKFEYLNLMVNHPHISPRMLKNIQCKTLVIEGKRDVIKPAHTRVIAENISGSRHEVIQNSGHNVFWDNFSYTNKLISDFIA